MLNVTPTEYVWKYNPLSGIPAGAQQNYGATVDWVLPGGRVMQHAIETVNSRTLSPDQIARRTAFFEYESDQQPIANNREANYIAANAIDSGTPRTGLYPLPFQGRQRVQLSGGSTEGMTQLSGGRNEGRIQLSGGRHPRPCSGRRGGLESTSAATACPNSSKLRAMLKKFCCEHKALVSLSRNPASTRDANS